MPEQQGCRLFGRGYVRKKGSWCRKECDNYLNMVMRHIFRPSLQEGIVLNVGLSVFKKNVAPLYSDVRKVWGFQSCATILQTLLSESTDHITPVLFCSHCRTMIHQALTSLTVDIVHTKILKDSYYSMARKDLPLLLLWNLHDRYNTTHVQVGGL